MYLCAALDSGDWPRLAAGLRLSGHIVAWLEVMASHHWDMTQELDNDIICFSTKPAPLTACCPCGRLLRLTLLQSRIWSTLSGELSHIDLLKIIVKMLILDAV